MPYYPLMLGTVLLLITSQRGCANVQTYNTVWSKTMIAIGCVIYHTGSINNNGSSVDLTESQPMSKAAYNNAKIQVIFIRMGRRPVSVGLNSPKLYLYRQYCYM
jgi:hypothetical protein